MKGADKFRERLLFLSDADLANFFISGESALEQWTASMPDFVGECVRLVDEEIARRAMNGFKVDHTTEGALDYDAVAVARALGQPQLSNQVAGERALAEMPAEGTPWRNLRRHR